MALGDAMREIVREQEEAKRLLCDQVRRELLLAIEVLADAASHPLIARSKIRKAHEHVKEAFKAANELDPPYEDDEEHPRERHSVVYETEDQRLDDPRHGQGAEPAIGYEAAWTGVPSFE